MKLKKNDRVGLRASETMSKVGEEEMKLKIKDLLAHLEKLKLDPETEILMCMDGMTEDDQQWEDHLGDLLYSRKRKTLILVNESFE